MAIKNIIVIDLQNIGVTNDYGNVPFVVRIDNPVLSSFMSYHQV
jgi:hypothetical protein